VAGNQTNGIAGNKDNIVVGKTQKEKELEQEYVLIPFCTTDLLISQDPKDSKVDAEKKAIEVNESGASDKGGKDEQAIRSESERLIQKEIQTEHINSTNNINTVITPVSIAGPSFDNAASSSPINTAGTLDSTVNAFKKHLFERFSLSKMHLLFHINKKDERGIVVKNKARIVAQGYTQEEGIYYDEVFAPVARIEAIRLFLAYASFKGFIVYQMDVKSAFLYRKIEEEVQQKSDGIFISQDKYVAEILKKFEFATIKTASTPMEPNKALIKDEEDEEVDVHLYKSMIGSLMYLTASRPDITFAVCACARDSPFDLEAFSDSDFAGASLDRKSTTGGALDPKSNA
ncbi:retrovirus-related pol polyprotein from transposon TNT 1-94, partial [Tanacetum coccineum]